MHRQQEAETDPFEAPLQLEMTSRSGKTLVATIGRLSFSHNAVEGFVRWSEGSDIPAGIVRAQGRGTAWGQRLALVSAAACSAEGQQSSLGAWAEATLLLPDLLGEKGEKIRVSIDLQSWTVKLQVDMQPELSKWQEIPPTLRELRIGPLLAEMTSRIFLGHSWLVLQQTSTHSGPSPLAGGAT